MPLFEQVGELTRTLVPEEMGALRFRAHGRGVKVWFDSERPSRNHFEAQLLPRRLFDGAEGTAIEVGFHAEHGDPEVNDATMAAVLGAERRWRPELGTEAEAGVFLGQQDWRRLSEVWLDPATEDPELSFELAARLADYIIHLTPLLPPS